MNNGIQPTVELATNNGTGFYPYPVMYGNNGGGFGNAFGGDGAIWLIVLLALIWGNNGNGNGFFGGNGGFDNGYAWLSNGQKDINSNISNGFYTTEVANCNRQMANMNQNFTNQLSLLNSLNDLNSRFSDCCCENRLGIANLTSTILAENCADREALSNGVRDIITSQNNGVQRILDQLCNDKIDAKNEKISDLQREILMKDLQASQIQQTATLRLGQEAEVDALYNRLSNCPVPSVPVYGRQPIFTCNNNGYGCGNF